MPVPYEFYNRSGPPVKYVMRAAKECLEGRHYIKVELRYDSAYNWVDLEPVLDFGGDFDSDEEADKCEIGMWLLYDDEPEQNKLLYKNIMDTLNTCKHKTICECGDRFIYDAYDLCCRCELYKPTNE